MFIFSWSSSKSWLWVTLLSQYKGFHNWGSLETVVNVWVNGLHDKFSWQNHADNTKWKSESPERWNNILTHYKEQAASQEVKPDLTVNTSCDLEKCMLLHYADLSYGNWMHCWCNVSEPLLFISLCIILIFNNIHSRPVFLEIPSFCPTARIGEFCH